MKNLTVLLPIYLMLVFFGCSSKDTLKPTAAVKYYLYYNMDGTDVKFEYYSDKYRDEEDRNPDLYYTKNFGYALWIHPPEQRILFNTSQFTSQAPAPGTFPITRVSFTKSRYVEYDAYSPQATGAFTITKIDDYEAEGTFAFTIEEDKAKGLAKVVVKGGRFKLKY